MSRRSTNRSSSDMAAVRTAHEWTVEQHAAFSFRGPSGNLAIADLAVVTRDGSMPVVVATERDDNPGISITNGAEQLAAQVLMRLFPERVGEQQPFRLVEHYRAASFGVGLGNIDATMKEVRFADFRLRHDRAAPRIGDVLEWRHLDSRVAAVLAEHTTVQGRDDDPTWRNRARHIEVESPKLQQAQTPRRGMRR
jgi:hypothetical protein